MSIIAGPVESVGIGGRVFSVAQDADTSRKLGGKENEQMMNGDGTTRTSQTRVAWSVSGLQLSIDDEQGDHEYLQGIADRAAQVPINLTYASGVVYGGTGTITGEMTTSSANQTASVTLSGPGKLERQ
jgi:osmotically-inducible protein OsmY